MKLPPPLDGQSAAYRRWRAEQWQRHCTTEALSLSPTLDDEADSEVLNTLCERVKVLGFARYQWRSQPACLRTGIHSLNERLGLRQVDRGVVGDERGLALLEDRSDTPQGRFIPYSSRAMNWHTDGYYNDLDAAVRCFSLHCIQPAASGGTLTLLDTSLLLIALYDQDPALVHELSHPQAMMLPRNRDAEGHDRPDRHVPILYANADGTLGMRFTARTQNIAWRTPATHEAAQQCLQIIEQLSAWHRRLTLQCGEGLITRNILHRRDAFSDSGATAPQRRQMLRGRYLQLPGANSTTRYARNPDAIR